MCRAKRIFGPGRRLAAPFGSAIPMLASKRIDRKSNGLHRVESDPHTALPTGPDSCIDESDACDAIVHSGK